MSFIPFLTLLNFAEKFNFIMTDFSSLQTKVEALKAMVLNNSITPSYLGSLLEDFIVQMKAIDMTGMSDDVATAMANASAALSKAEQALSKSGEALTSSSSAVQNALSAIRQAESAVTAAEVAKTTASEAKSIAEAAKSQAANAQGNANIAIEKAEAAHTLAQKHENAIGLPSGIAPLDESGIVPARYLPSYLDDVVEFNGMLQLTPPSIEAASTANPGAIYYCTATNTFICRGGGSAVGDVVIKYFNNWFGAEPYGDFSVNGRVPVRSKIYLDVATNKQYRWSGTTLVTTGSDLALGYTDTTAFPGNEGAQLQTDVEDLQEELSVKADVYDLGLVEAHLNGVQILPFNGTYDASHGRIPPTAGVWWTDGSFLFKSSNNSYYSTDYNVENEDGSLSARTDRLFRCGNNLYRVVDGELKELGGSALGNDYNVTVAQPISGYYDLQTAIQATYDKKLAAEGLNITFAIAKGSWKTYKYVGSGVGENFLVAANWIDTAGQSAGGEPLVNVNELCGEGALQYGAYTLESAIKAITDKESESGITYRKAGMVITYKVGDGKWESKQLMQSVASFNVPGAWEPFGSSADEQVKTSDKPVKGGKDAFSTGGAHTYIPTKHQVTQEDGTVSIQFLNDKDEPVMDPVEFLASQGGGGDASGTIVSIAFQKSPLYAALGSSLATKAAIRSVTTVGNVETDNSIESLQLIDKDTKAVVWSAKVNKASSPSMTSFTYDIDFTSFFSVAGQKTFTLIATDDTGKTGRKNITVIAEDLTLSCTQRLSETVAPTDTQKYIEMYAFQNNQSEGGIRCNVDILVGGEWKAVHSEVVTNAFSRSVMFNAVELGLKHGAYKLRMQGESVDSGVKGNTVYSTIMCVDPASRDMLVAIRYDDHNDGKIKLFESVSVDVAAYRVDADGTATTALVDLYFGNTKITQVKIDPEKVVNVRKQISGYAQGDVIPIEGRFGSVKSPKVEITVDGSVLDISLKTGAVIDLDFSSRSNNEADHTITSNGINMAVNGSNWTTNGFIEFLGQNTLRIAENVTANLPFAPFGFSTIEQTGAVVQMKIATRNVRDKEARLISCYDPDSGAGFYVCGNKAAIFCKNGINAVEERAFENNKEVTLAFVVEPSSVYQERAGTKYSMMKLYIDGEQAAVLGYVPGQGNILSSKSIDFNGTDGDLYLFYLMAYRSYYEWAQAFDNYLVKGSDTEAMVDEYNAENVLVSQTAEGTTALRPSSTALYARGIPYMVTVASEEVFHKFDFGNGSDDNGMTTSPKFKGFTQFLYQPNRPWRSFKAVNVTKKRQGTTSSQRPEKNEDDDYSKATITPLYPEYTSDAELRATLSADDLKDIEETFALFKIGYIRIGRNTMPIKRAMNKIDYSDSSCANNGGVCDMMNATFRALGSSYMTPAQRFYDGSWDKGDVHLTGIEMNHSIANFPCTIFRSTSDTLQNVYFHTRGSYMESKKEQSALGFKDVSGYNKGCLNYGDFKELFCAPGQTLDEYVAAADKSTWEYPTDIEDVDSEKHNVIVISEYCGRSFKVFRRSGPGAEWKETTGSMKQVGGKWVVSGDCVNPVTGFELLNYTGICWWMGIATVGDMMKMETGTSSWVKKLVDKGLVSNTSYPVWTQFFECMVEDDQLAIDYAMGRKVPFDLFNTLRFMDSVDYSKTSLASTWKLHWCTMAWRYMSIESVDAYHIFTDYLAAIDQRAKNMQPMWFLEDGCKIENGVYVGVDEMEPMRMYLNKVYDCDTCNGQDNDGGKTCDPEVDPDKPSDEATGYTNPYAGWGSILFNNIAKTKTELVQCGRPDDKGVSPTLSLMTVAAAMRSAQTTLENGRTIAPFSPDGAKYYFLEQRINLWPKKVCSYDCERKYISYTATSNRIYFYAHQGSGRTAIVPFIDTRWLVRDGFYQTGGFFSNPLTMRINCRSTAKIRITAAARGYFAVGYENVGQISGNAVFLEAGQSHEFSDFSKVDGTTLYIYQVERMSMLDISDLTISGADFSKCVLLEILRVGSASHANVPLGSYPMQNSLPLGNLPFLHTVDIRNTAIATMDCSGCPRLEHVEAVGSQLQTLSLAPTSPINDINLPDTMTELRFVGLPKLTYTGTAALDGLHISAFAKVQKLRVESTPNINAVALLRNIVSAAGSALRSVRVVDQVLRGNGQELLTMIERGVVGMDDAGNENRPHPVMSGDYSLTALLENAQIACIEANIEGIKIVVVVEAFVDTIDKVNAEYYSGSPEVATVTLDNIGEHLLYYNGETSAEYVARVALENESVHNIITK